jgi:hypothetical protein
MVSAFGAVIAAALPPGSTVLVSVGAPLLIAVLVVGLVVFGAVLVQGALSAPPARHPEVRVETCAGDAAPSRDAA